MSDHESDHESDHVSEPRVAPRREPRVVAITGASGMLGGALVKALRAQGIEVRTIGRGNESDIQWDPARQVFDQSSLEGVDSVVHLAGSNIGERWTTKSRAEILESRVQGTTLMAGSVARMSPKPEVLVSASAMGFYGSRGDEWLSEASAPGNDYLAEVCRAWEDSTQPARDAGVRVVNLRTGIVLAREGGALAKMLLPFQLGAGGKLASGTQWMSWISLADWVGAVLHAMRTSSIIGPMNVSSPEPVTNATFTETLGRILRRPTVATVPAFVLKTMFGEMAEATLLASQRMKPEVLEMSHYQFQHPTLSSALRSALGEA